MQRKKLGTSLPTLSAEASAFLKAAEPIQSVDVVPPEVVEPVPTIAPSPAKPAEQVDAPAVSETDVRAEAGPEVERSPKGERERKEKKVAANKVSEAPEMLVSDSFKLPQTLHRKLLRASSERKLDRVKPYTKQDIVAAALTEWFSKNGYEGVG